MNHLELPIFRPEHYADLSNYSQLLKMSIPDRFVLMDHFNGFSKNGYSLILDNLNKLASERNKVYEVYHHNVIPDTVCFKYPNLNIRVSEAWQHRYHTWHFEQHTQPASIDYQNFVCSFNGSPHVSRKLLVSAIKKFGYFDPDYCSKNFTYSVDNIDGYINEYMSDALILYRKFFISEDSEKFFQTPNTFGHTEDFRYQHTKNMHILEDRITNSFLHIVSETLATSYVPYVTEKSFYSIVSKGLFLAYAQPGWHAYIEKYYGFKLYTNLFNYTFDSIVNPIERLVELMTMVGKYSKLTPSEWHDLYLLEQDSIEFNWNHYHSGNYRKRLQSHE